MVFVSITRLRIRAWRYLPGFFLDTGRTLMQVRRADGFLAGSLLRDRRRTFWTMTLWQDQADMRRYITSGSHLRAMPRLLDWCDEASVVHWTRADADVPDWAEADRRMRADGRPSKVRHPAEHHRELTFAALRLTQPVPIRRKAAPPR